MKWFHECEIFSCSTFIFKKKILMCFFSISYLCSDHFGNRVSPVLPRRVQRHEDMAGDCTYLIGPEECFLVLPTPLPPTRKGREPEITVLPHRPWHIFNTFFSNWMEAFMSRPPDTSHTIVSFLLFFNNFPPQESPLRCWCSHFLKQVGGISPSLRGPRSLSVPYLLFVR